MLVFAACLLLLSISITHLLFNTITSIKHDATIINELGAIRGSIQRASKLSLARDHEVVNLVVNRVDKLIDEFMGTSSLTRSAKGFDTVNRNLIELESLWKNLKSLISQYQSSPSAELQAQIRLLSEECWNLADEIVHAAEATSTTKVKNMGGIFWSLVINDLSLVLMLFLIYSYVRNKLENESMYDSMTRLYNRKMYEKEIKRECVRTERYKKDMSLVLFDVDNFKNINDTYGHHVGDKILKKIAKVIMDNKRESDLAYRIGGEEFAVIMTDTNTFRAMTAAEKLRKAIEEAHYYKDLKVTSSFGVAGYMSEVADHELFKYADDALYVAKNKGRNRVEVHKGEYSKQPI